MLRADPQGLTSAASQVDAAADALADIDIATAFADASDALVGSATSQACLWFSTRAGAAVQVYAEGLHGLADASRHTAADLTNTDAVVGSQFSGVTP